MLARKIVLTIIRGKNLSYCVPNSAENPQTKIWRVSIEHNRKKYRSESVSEQSGNPYWDFKVSLIASPEDCAVLKVKDGDDRDIGQFRFDLFPELSENPCEFEAVLKRTKRNHYPSGSLLIKYMYNDLDHLPAKHGGSSLNLMKSISFSKLFPHNYDENDERESFVSSLTSMTGKKSKDKASNPMSPDFFEEPGLTPTTNDYIPEASRTTEIKRKILFPNKKSGLFKGSTSRLNDEFVSYSPNKVRRGSEDLDITLFTTTARSSDTFRKNSLQAVLDKLKLENEKLHHLNEELLSEKNRLMLELDNSRKELDTVTLDLSNLRCRLLADGLTQYLELNSTNINSVYQEIFQRISSVENPFRH